METKGNMCDICVTVSNFELVECDGCKKQCCLNYDGKNSCIANISWWEKVLCKICIPDYCVTCLTEKHTKPCICLQNRVCGDCYCCRQKECKLKQICKNRSDVRS